MHRQYQKLIFSHLKYVIRIQVQLLVQWSIFEQMSYFCFVQITQNQLLNLANIIKCFPFFLRTREKGLLESSEEIMEQNFGEKRAQLEQVTFLFPWIFHETLENKKLPQTTLHMWILFLSSRKYNSKSKIVALID